MSPPPKPRSRNPRVPSEIVDSIIDCLAPDLKALGACGLVCSEWLPRSRHHIFSNVHLTSSRVHHFTHLTESPACTFASAVSCISIDGLPPPSESNITFNQKVILVCETLARCRTRFPADTIRLRNICWTAISFPDQQMIMQCLGRFRSIKHLELDQMAFHDMRAIVSITSIFPRLERISADRLTFMKYKDHVIVSTSRLRLPLNLHSVHLGGGDEVSVFLSCIASHGDAELPALRNLTMESVPAEDFVHVERALNILGHRVHKPRIGFSSVGSMHKPGDLGDRSGDPKLANLHSCDTNSHKTGDHRDQDPDQQVNGQSTYYSVPATKHLIDLMGRPP